MRSVFKLAESLPAPTQDLPPLPRHGPWGIFHSPHIDHDTGGDQVRNNQTTAAPEEFPSIQN